MMASAAGLKRLALRDRKMYLLSTAATDVIVTTYHGSCVRSTIETIIAVSTAPLGNSQAFFRNQRIATSTRPEPAIAASMPVNTARRPSPGAAMAANTIRMIVSMPFGVLKNFPILRHILETSCCRTIEIAREDQAVNAHALQK